MTGKLLFQGGCHCESVKFEFRSLKKVEVWTCNCSICSLNNYQHLFVRHSDFNLISGKEYLTSYQFATHTAEHLFCRRCGVKSFYQPRSHPDSFSIDIRCVKKPPKIVRVVKFDGKNHRGAIE